MSDTTDEPRPFEGVDTRHYPDLVASGGLVPALQAAAEAGGLDTGQIDTRSKAVFADYTFALTREGAASL
ncbi:hypothetical protein ALMP_82910 [Streptomyces sp. A012304]|nr:hypothetical protein ALMP_82910 [Streptomyces sp. A012304]